MAPASPSRSRRRSVPWFISTPSCPRTASLCSTICQPSNRDRCVTTPRRTAKVTRSTPIPAAAFAANAQDAAWVDAINRTASDPQRNQSSSRTEIRAGELLHEPPRLFVFVGFSDDRRLALVVRFGVVVFVLVIIIVIVRVSRRHRVAHDGDESPLGSGKV